MIPVRELYEYCQMMLRGKWGYIYGTAGTMWTQLRQDTTENEMAQKYGQQWVDHMVADCSGVMVYIWKQYGLSIYHGSNTIRKKYCGELTKTPKAGYAAFKVRDNDDFYHIGIVDESCEYVYESRSTQAGFKHDSATSKWAYFAPFKDVLYEDKPMDYNGIITGNNVRIRSAPSTDGQIIGHCNKGDKVLVKTLGDGWAYCEAGTIERNGYISSQYIKVVENEIVDPQPTPTPSKTQTTLTDAHGQTITLLGDWRVM